MSFECGTIAAVSIFVSPRHYISRCQQFRVDWVRSRIFGVNVQHVYHPLYDLDLYVNVRSVASRTALNHFLDFELRIELIFHSMLRVEQTPTEVLSRQDEACW